MRLTYFSVLPVAAFLAFAWPSEGRAEKYVLDKPHTQIVFAVDHLGFVKSYGKFTDYAGTIDWNKTEPAKSKVDVTIQTGSLDMGDATWNEHLSAPKYFDVAKFPAMTFKSTSVAVTGKNTANITGDLTLRGVTKPVVLAAVMNKEGKHPFMNRMEAGFSATTKIKRSDFGMTEAIPFVSDEVTITLEVEAYQPGEAGQGVDNK